MAGKKCRICFSLSKFLAWCNYLYLNSTREKVIIHFTLQEEMLIFGAMIFGLWPQMIWWCWTHLQDILWICEIQPSCFLPRKAFKFCCIQSRWCAIGLFLAFVWHNSTDDEQGWHTGNGLQQTWTQQLLVAFSIWVGCSTRWAIAVPPGMLTND